MPFIPVNISNEDIFIGIWKVDSSENESFFRERLVLFESEEEKLERIKVPEKRLEWLASRLALKTCLPFTDPLEVKNTLTGEPVSPHVEGYFSFSHCPGFGGGVYSKKYRVGIDLEALKTTRDFAVKRMFMNPTELDCYNSNPTPERWFFLVWSSKEALYKWYSWRELSFRNHLAIQPQNQIPDKGTIQATLQKGLFSKEIMIHYQFFETVLLTYLFTEIE